MHPLRLTARAFGALLVILALGLSGLPAAAADTGTITGTVFKDANRNGVHDADEEPWAGHTIRLFASDGSFVASAVSDAEGGYRFGGLAGGTYRVRYAPATWRDIRAEWVTTTTGSLWPDVTVAVSGSTVADFGWRRIVTSTTLGLPISSYTGPRGLAVESYNDVLSARHVHDALMAGTLVGEEAANVRIRFAYGTTDAMTASVSSNGGAYTSYQATVSVTYLSWLDSVDKVLFHEYGHAWSLYHAFMVQQDPEMTGYLEARGLLGDDRVNSSYVWSTREMIAEDYRQLFGTPSAASPAQMNREIPPAGEVEGLADYLAGPFVEPPTDSDEPDEEPASQPEPSAEDGSTDGSTDTTTTRGNGKGGGGGGGPKKK